MSAFEPPARRRAARRARIGGRIVAMAVLALAIASTLVIVRRLA